MNISDVQDYLADWFINEFEKREYYDESESEDEIISMELGMLECDIRNMIKWRRGGFK